MAAPITPPIFERNLDKWSKLWIFHCLKIKATSEKPS